MVLLIDNYDSFSYNLYQLIGTIDPDIKVVRNDAIDIPGIRALAPDHIVLSPGPGKPANAGICEQAVRELYAAYPMLGICLGHQAIYEAFGGTVSYANELMHGKASNVLVDAQNALFQGLPPVIRAGRYHSLAAVGYTLPKALTVTARTEGGEIMAVSHWKYPVYGLQFHPESILTPEGKTIIANFIGGVIGGVSNDP